MTIDTMPSRVQVLHITSLLPRFSRFLYINIRHLKHRDHWCDGIGVPLFAGSPPVSLMEKHILQLLL